MRAAWAPCGCPRAPTWVPLGLQMAAQAPLRCSNGLLECTLIFQECSKTRKNTCFLSSRPQACVQSHLLASMCCLGAAGMPKGVRMDCSGTTWPPKWLWGTKRSKNTCFYVFSCVECSTTGRPGSPKWTAWAPLGCPKGAPRGRSGATWAPKGPQMGRLGATGMPKGCRRAPKWAARAALGRPRALKWAAWSATWGPKGVQSSLNGAAQCAQVLLSAHLCRSVRTGAAQCA